MSFIFSPVGYGFGCWVEQIDGFDQFFTEDAGEDYGFSFGHVMRQGVKELDKKEE